HGGLSRWGDSGHYPIPDHGQLPGPGPASHRPSGGWARSGTGQPAAGVRQQRSHRDPKVQSCHAPAGEQSGSPGAEGAGRTYGHSVGQQGAGADLAPGGGLAGGTLNAFPAPGAGTKSVPQESRIGGNPLRSNG